MPKATYHIDPLDKDNYDTWAIQAEAVLVKSKLWKYVSTPLDEKTDTTEIEADKQAKAELILIIAPSQLKEVKKCNTAKDLWDKLKQIHASKGPARKATLLKQLILTKLEGSDVRTHLNKFMDTVDKLADMDVSINEDLLTIMMLYSLSSDYENFRVAIESRDILPKPEELKIKIIEESDARHHNDNYESGQEQQQEENAFFASCKICKRTGRRIFQKKTHKVCSDCWKKNKDKKKSNKNTDSLYAEECFLTSTRNNQDDWVLDSGCTSHMTHHHEHFKDMKTVSRKLNFASENHSTEILGEGRITFSDQQRGRRLHLENALYVPSLSTNLLSVPKMTSHGATVTFNNNRALVRNKSGDLLLSAEKSSNGLYYVRKPNIEQSFAATPATGLTNTKQGSIQDWHRKLGHMNYKDLQLALNNETVTGMRFNKNEILSLPDCEICIQAKMTRVPSPSQRTTPRTTERLEIVHSDVCGPIRTPTHAKNRYFVTFIDDYSRYGRVYFLKNKSEVLDKFKEYKQEMEKFTGNKIKHLQTDNGTEYVNGKFQAYLKEHGIARRLSAPYTPHQNGIAERKNRTLVEKARAMLIDAKAPMHLWAEAVNTANYLANRSVNSAIENKTPFEKWVLRKPCLNHLHPFGSKAFILKKGPRGHKFAPKAIPGMFVGYSDTSKAYRVYVPNKTFISADVKVVKANYYKSPTDVNNFEYNKNTNCDSVSETMKTQVEIDDADDTQQEIPIENIETQQDNLIEIVENQQDDSITENVAADSTLQYESVDENVDDEQDSFTETSIRESLSHELADTEPEPEPNSYSLRDRSAIQKPQRYDDFVLAAVAEVQNLPKDPVTYKQALESSHKEQWIKAMLSEINSLNENKTWDLVNLPDGRKALPCKWVFRLKTNPDGSIDKFKARLVIKGYSQQKGIDYDKTFSPVARLSTIRAIIAIAAQENLNLRQFDVATAFLNGSVEEEIFMKQPEGFQDGTKQVCKLNRSLYGLKQAPRCWNSCIAEFLKTTGFQQSEADPCLYIRIRGKSKVLIGLYVDDGLMASNTPTAGDEFIKELKTRFKITTRPAFYFLGMEIKAEKGKITLCQQAYIKKILEKYGMTNCKPTPTPIIKESINDTEPDVDVDFPYRQTVGALTYLAVGTRPDIAYAVSVASRNLEKPSMKDIMLVKRIFRYLKGTIDKGLVYKQSNESLQKLLCYSDSDLAGDQATGRSTTGMVCLFSGAAISWKSQRQTVVSISSTEAEIIAASETAQEMLWLNSLMKGLVDLKKPILYLDNESAIKLSHNPKYEYHKRTKHIKLKNLFVRECVINGELEVKQVPSVRQLADMLTKPLFGPRLEVLSGQIGLKRI